LNPEAIRAAGADRVAFARDSNIEPSSPASRGTPQPRAAVGAGLPPFLLAPCAFARLHPACIASGGERAEFAA
jgi:hypothetical protein